MGMWTHSREYSKESVNSPTYLDRAGVEVSLVVTLSCL